MDWFVVDKNYVNYLKQFDKNVGYVDYGNRLKLHVGIILEINGFKYYVPISSAKPKHNAMSNGIDFHKLQDPNTGFLYAVININNMIPVPDNCVSMLKYDQLSNYREFDSEKSETNYVYLLQKEKAIIDCCQEALQSKAEKLYKKCVSQPSSTLAKRCCNFKMLENKLTEFVK